MSEQRRGVAVELPQRRVQPKSFTGQGWAELRGWNACLDEIAKLGPLYTRPVPADPGEVGWLCEQLSVEIAKANTAERMWYKVSAERNTLRAQLAEAHGLLRQVRDSFGHSWHQMVFARGIDAALSASAEQSASPGCFVGADQAAYPSERRQNAPVERDELAAFVKWANVEYHVLDGEELNMSHVDVKANLVGWQARAALERRASATECSKCGSVMSMRAKPMAAGLNRRPHEDSYPGP